MAHLEPVWHKEAIAPEVERVLEQLGSLDAVTLFYLAGGTALALHFGHRRSVDLDFFSAELFHEDQLLASLQSATRLAVVSKDRHTLHLHVDGVKVSFLGYPYAMLFPVMGLAGVTIADPRDVACMKISALAGRGTRRDFFDVYVAATQYGLHNLLSLFQQKYAAANYNMIHILKSLTFFADAEREPIPDLLIPVTWEHVKQFFRHEVPRLPLP